MNNFMFEEHIRLLFDLEDIEFLKKIVERYPEMKMLAGPADASPEGIQELKQDALAYRVFECEVDKSAIEADRTFLGLILFRAACLRDRSKFPRLSDKNWQALLQVVHGIVRSSSDVEIVLYALSAQDLGKTRELANIYFSEFGFPSEDHDKLLGEITEALPDLFPGFQNLLDDQKEIYLNGLLCDLNLGQLVQGENLPCNLIKVFQTDERSRNIRILIELFDFAGATGHVNSEESLLMDNDNFMAFKSAFDALQTGDSVRAYTHYIKQRGEHVGVVESTADIFKDREGYALSRIAALSRAFTKDQGATIRKVWKQLDREERNLLVDEMGNMGMKSDTPMGILVYYSPAMIANAVNSKESFSEGLTLGLKALMNTYRSVRPDVQGNGTGEIIVNVNELAKLATSNPERLTDIFKIRRDKIKKSYHIEVQSKDDEPKRV